MAHHREHTGKIETVRWHYRKRNGIRLACPDYGGSVQPGVILLHGLAGHADEWAETASWLSTSHRVVAPEQRGHGRGDCCPEDMSRAAFVEDAAMWVKEMDLVPAVVVGHLLAGHTAFLLAARHPDLVHSLVVAEATPTAAPSTPSRVQAWLET
jgi:pimeloyl-ACP methyl ester carboxylesterase